MMLGQTLFACFIFTCHMPLLWVSTRDTRLVQRSQPLETDKKDFTGQGNPDTWTPPPHPTPRDTHKYLPSAHADLDRHSLYKSNKSVRTGMRNRDWVRDHCNIEHCTIQYNFSFKDFTVLWSIFIAENFILIIFLKSSPNFWNIKKGDFERRKSWVHIATLCAIISIKCAQCSIALNNC